MRAVLLRPFVVSIGTFALLLGGAPSAFADDLAPYVTVEQPKMDFTLDYDDVSQQVCAIGVLRHPPSTSPEWTLTLAGARSTGAPINGSTSAGTQNATLCLPVFKLSAPYGDYTARFTFKGATDPPSVVVALVSWTPTEDDIVNTGQAGSVHLLGR